MAAGESEPPRATKHRRHRDNRRRPSQPRGAYGDPRPSVIHSVTSSAGSGRRPRSGRRAAAPPPPPPPAPEHPNFVLIGTAAGQSISVAVFIDNATRDAVRLHSGEGLGGWILQSVVHRTATLQKGGQTETFELPRPTDLKGPVPVVSTLPPEVLPSPVPPQRPQAPPPPAAPAQSKPL
jgi:hypothetical protein